MIRVDGLIFDYLGHRALHGVSIEIPKGTVTALVGPNGAGKSTLMRCIAGLDTPLAGQITIDGIDVQEYPRTVHTKLGYLSDFFGLYQNLTVSQCLTYAAASQKIPEHLIAARVIEVASYLGLSEKLNNLSSDLSRGQRQRVAIGQAIVHMPEVLLLDEPASGLDPEARADLSVLFRQLHAKGMTLLVSSHILSELDEYCTHILSIRNGRVSKYENLATTATGTEGILKTLIAIKIASPIPHLGTLLADYEVVHLDVAAATQTTVYMPANDMTARAKLLSELIKAEVPVISFAEVRTSLQNSYEHGIANKTV